MNRHRERSASLPCASREPDPLRTRVADLSRGLPHLRRSMPTRTGAPGVTVTVCLRSPSCGWRQVIS